MANSAIALSTNILQKNIFQMNHNFSVGQIVRFTGSSYVLAQASSLVNSQTIGMVSYIVSANVFVLTQAGYVSQLSFLVVPGQQYYLSPTDAGSIQLAPPSAPGQYISPIFVPDTTSSGYYFNNYAQPYTTDNPFTWANVTTNTNMAVNAGYFANGTGSLNFVLPNTYPVGGQFQIVDQSGHGFVILQTLGGGAQQILDLALSSTAGSTGTATAVGAGQSISLVAESVGGVLRVVSNKGTFTYA